MLLNMCISATSSVPLPTNMIIAESSTRLSLSNYRQYGSEPGWLVASAKAEQAPCFRQRKVLEEGYQVDANVFKQNLTLVGGGRLNDYQADGTPMSCGCDASERRRNTAGSDLQVLGVESMDALRALVRLRCTARFRTWAPRISARLRVRPQEFW